MSDPNQQPIQRTIRKRVAPPPGVLPSPRGYGGIFFYKNHEEMTRDRERWTIDAVSPGKPNVAEYTRAATWDDVKKLASS